MTCPQCPTSRIVDPPTVVYRDFFYPAPVEIVHPVEIVNRHHCVPVPYHVVAYSCRDEYCGGAAAPGPQVAARTKSHKRKAASRKAR